MNLFKGPAALSNYHTWRWRREKKSLKAGFAALVAFHLIMHFERRLECEILQ
tara:strand:+ start:59 stop:214 length:156 start_codon:yes stop_codon:yes gene_type:complete